MKSRFIGVTLFVVMCSTIISAGATSLKEIASQVKKITPQSSKAVSSKSNMPILTEIGDIEIITALDGQHYWQLSVTNTCDRNARNFKVYVDVEGFRNEDRVSTVAVIETLTAGQTAFARAKLPEFEGMHQFRIRAGSVPKVVQIPRPFRKDANGNPSGALKIEKVWARKFGGKIHWYMETKPNIYGTILPNKVQLMVTFRERKKKYCHQEAFKKIGYMDHQQLISYISPETNYMATNSTPIKPGDRMRFYGELNDATAKPHLPSKVDRLTVKMLSGEEKSVLLPEDFFAPYGPCTDEQP